LIYFLQVADNKAFCFKTAQIKGKNGKRTSLSAEKGAQIVHLRNLTLFQRETA